MEYITPITLIERYAMTDNIGQAVWYENETPVYCRENVVGTKEFYNAVAVGITPTAELQMRKCDYNGQSVVLWNDAKYSVIRTIPKGKFDVVLVIGLKQGTK